MDSEEPDDNERTEDFSTEESMGSEFDNKIKDIAEAYVESLRKGKSNNQQELVDRYPELAPALEKKLKQFEAIYRATLGSSRVEPDDFPSVEISDKADKSSADDSFELREIAITNVHREATVRIRCPHCGTPVQLVSKENHEVSCGSCGSAVQIQVPDTRADEALAIPKQISRFNIKRLLGQGAFGSVYLAEDPKLDREVALKVPRRGFFTTDKEEQRFFREAKSAAQLRHPNIVQVYEVSEQDNIPYIISEFIDGLTLGDIASAGLMSFRETAEFMVQISNAVDYAHRKGVIHRDLKPANILVDHDRNAYVTDFGLARREDPGEVTMTMDGVILGTPAYMSPEQAAGIHDRVDARSDVYSLGVIFYRLLCRELPFSGTKRMLIEQLMRDEPRPPRKFNEHIPKDLETITLKTLSKEPKKRYQKAGDLADDIQRWLDRKPVLARPVGNITKLWRWSKRHPTVAALCSAIALLLATGAILAGVWATREIKLRTVANQNAERADLNRLESEGRLNRLLMESGSNALNKNDLTQSLVWYSDALELVDRENSRTRIGMVQDRLPKLNRILTTEANISDIEYSSDGKRIVAIGEGTLEVFDAVTGQTLLKQKPDWLHHSGFAISPTGHRIATVAIKSNVFQLWDVDGDKPIKNLGHADRVSWCEIDQTGELVVTSGFDSYIRLWNSSDGSKRSEVKFDGQKIENVHFVPNTSLIFAVMINDQYAKSIRVWDHATDKVVVLLDNQYVDLGRSMFLDDGTKVITSMSFYGDDQEQDERVSHLQVWQIATGEKVGDAVTIPHGIHNAFLSDDEKGVFAVSMNGDFNLWNLENGESQNLGIPTIRNKTVRMDDTRRLMAFSSNDATVRFFWSENGGEVCSLVRNSGKIMGFDFHPNGRQIAVGGENGVLQIWDFAGSLSTAKTFQHEGRVHDAIFTPDGKRCLSIGDDGKGYIWNSATGEKLGAVLNHAGEIKYCNVSADGKLFVTTADDNSTKIWDSTTGAQVEKTLNLECPSLFVTFSPGQKYVAIGGTDGKVTCWRVADIAATTTPVFEIQTTARHLQQIRYNQDGSLLATVNRQDGVRIWDGATGKPRNVQLQGMANDCQFLPDGKRIVWGSPDGWLNVSNLSDGSMEQRFFAGGGISSITVKDKKVFSNASGGKTKIWTEVAGKYQIESEFEHPAIPHVYFSDHDSKSSMLANAGGVLGVEQLKWGLGATLLWDLEDGSLLAPPLLQEWPTHRVYFSPDDTKFLTSGDNSARLYSVAKSELPVEDIQRISRLYAQLEYDDDSSKLKVMPPAKQFSEYTELSTKYPELFFSDAAEIKNWNDHVKRIPELNRN